MGPRILAFTLVSREKRMVLTKDLSSCEDRIAKLISVVSDISTLALVNQCYCVFDMCCENIPKKHSYPHKVDFVIPIG